MAEYIGKLETEVARLQQLDAQVNSEKNALARQNNAIKTFLADQSIDTHLDSMSLGHNSIPNDELSDPGSATVSFRFDPEIEQTRMVLDAQSWSHASESLSKVPEIEAQQRHSLQLPSVTVSILQLLLHDVELHR